MDTASLASSAAQVAADLSLEEEAVLGLRRWLAQPDELPSGVLASEIELRFMRCALVFRNANLKHPYFETTLTLIRFGNDVGTYRLITDVNGKPEDDYLEWHGF